MSKYAAIEGGIFKGLSAEEIATVAHGTIQDYKRMNHRLGKRVETLEGFIRDLVDLAEETRVGGLSNDAVIRWAKTVLQEGDKAS